MNYTLATFCLLSSAVFGSAFTPPAAVPRVRSDLSLHMVVKSSTHPIGDDVAVERRNFLTKGLFAAAMVAATSIAEPTPARADVADGNELPPGVAQFSRLVRAKVELTKVQKRVRTMSEEFDQKEWDNLGQFLRKIYGLGDDMKYLSNSFDEDKKKKSNELTETLRKLSKAADVPASTKNAPEFVAYTQQLIVTLDKYFDLLRDVPDEI